MDCGRTPPDRQLPPFAGRQNPIAPSWRALSRTRAVVLADTAAFVQNPIDRRQTNACVGNILKARFAGAPS